MCSATFKMIGQALRDEARNYLKQVPLVGEIQSGPKGADEPHNQLFTHLTGLTHKELRDAWYKTKPKKELTSCNGFVQLYGKRLGFGDLGRFDLDKLLPSIGKGIAWIPSNSGALPKYGDIFIQIKPPKTPQGMGLLHQGISLDFDGGTWNTAEGGQGGSGTGYDIIKRKTNLLSDGVIGWVDIDLLARCTPQFAVVPKWLLGHWDVSWRGQNWYYFFAPTRQVTYTQRLGLRNMLPLIAEGEGRFIVNDSNVVIARWNATGTVERFECRPGTNQTQMWGWLNEVEPIGAVKRDASAIFGTIG